MRQGPIHIPRNNLIPEHGLLVMEATRSRHLPFNMVIIQFLQKSAMVFRLKKHDACVENAWRLNVKPERTIIVLRGTQRHLFHRHAPVHRPPQALDLHIRTPPRLVLIHYADLVAERARGHVNGRGPRADDDVGVEDEDVVVAVCQRAREQLLHGHRASIVPPRVVAEVLAHFAEVVAVARGVRHMRLPRERAVRVWNGEHNDEYLGRGQRAAQHLVRRLPRGMWRVRVHE